jgi:hypothetical protein
MSFTFTAKDTGAIRQFRREFPNMARRAVNRVAPLVAGEAARVILQNYNVSADAVQGGIFVVPAKEDSGYIAAKVIAKGKRLPATMFLPEQTAKGISIEIRKGVRREIAGAFIGTKGRKNVKRAIAKIAAGAARSKARLIAQSMGSARQAVFVRKTSKRLPIKEVGGTSVANMFSSGVVTQALKRFGQTAIARELQKELNLFKPQGA